MTAAIHSLGSGEKEAVAYRHACACGSTASLKRSLSSPARSSSRDEETVGSVQPVRLGTASEKRWRSQLKQKEALLAETGDPQQRYLQVLSVYCV